MCIYFSIQNHSNYSNLKERRNFLTLLSEYTMTRFKEEGWIAIVIGGNRYFGSLQWYVHCLFFTPHITTLLFVSPAIRYFPQEETSKWVIASVFSEKNLKRWFSFQKVLSLFLKDIIVTDVVKCLIILINFCKNCCLDQKVPNKKINKKPKSNGPIPSTWPNFL